MTGLSTRRHVRTWRFYVIKRSHSRWEIDGLGRRSCISSKPNLYVPGNIVLVLATDEPEFANLARVPYVNVGVANSRGCQDAANRQARVEFEWNIHQDRESAGGAIDDEAVNRLLVKGSNNQYLDRVGPASAAASPLGGSHPARALLRGALRL